MLKNHLINNKKTFVNAKQVALCIHGTLEILKK